MKISKENRKSLKNREFKKKLKEEKFNRGKMRRERSKKSFKCKLRGY
jgi:hypothetical protein